MQIANRHRNDYGAILLLDPRLQVRSNQEQLSRWLRSVTTNINSFEEIVMPLRAFFRHHAPVAPPAPAPVLAPVPTLATTPAATTTAPIKAIAEKVKKEHEGSEKQQHQSARTGNEKEESNDTKPATDAGKSSRKRGVGNASIEQFLIKQRIPPAPVENRRLAVSLPVSKESGDGIVSAKSSRIPSGKGIAKMFLKSSSGTPRVASAVGKTAHTIGVGMNAKTPSNTVEILGEEEDEQEVEVENMQPNPSVLNSRRPSQDSDDDPFEQDINFNFNLKNSTSNNSNNSNSTGKVRSSGGFMPASALKHNRNGEIPSTSSSVETNSRGNEGATEQDASRAHSSYHYGDDNEEGEDDEIDVWDPKAVTEHARKKKRDSLVHS
jgi:Helicase C-terminal domain